MNFLPVPGTYEHYKGGRYTLLFQAHDSTNAQVPDDDPGRWMAVYVSHTTGRINVRGVAEFCEPVKWPDGRTQPRFTLVAHP